MSNINLSVENQLRLDNDQGSKFVGGYRMYALQMIEKESLLKLTLDENLNEDELRMMLKDLKHARRKINDDYRLLIILPEELRQSNIDEKEKIDLSVYMAKLKGLRQVVLQTPEKDSANVKRLTEIYKELSIRVSVTHNSIETQKKLGLLW